MSDAVLEMASAVNDDYRTAAMNRRYYACRLAAVKRWSTTLDIVVAVGTSAAVAAWTVWQDGPGTYAWKMLGAIATVVAVVKPFLQLSKDVERYSELVVGYAALFYDMKQLVTDVKTTNGIAPAIRERYCAIRQKTKDLGIKDDLTPRKRLHQRCYDEVTKELPNTSLWWPQEELHG